VNLGAGEVEYAYNTSGITAAGASNTTAFGYGPAGAAVGSINSTTLANSATIMRCRFLTPIQPTDKIELEYDRYADGNWTTFEIYGTFTLNTALYGVGHITVTGSDTDVDVFFGNAGITSAGATYGSAGNAWAGVGAGRWRVKKSRAGIPVGFQGASSTEMGLAPSGVFAAGIPGAVTLQERSANPSDPTSGTEGRIYIKGDKLVIQFNDAGTVRYKYLDLTGTGVTWVHTTTPV
jgi:hypothetical protein